MYRYTIVIDTVSTGTGTGTDMYRYSYRDRYIIVLDTVKSTVISI